MYLGARNCAYVPQGSGTGDWVARSTAAGVLASTALATSAQISAAAFSGTETVPPQLTTSVAPFGQPGSCLFTIHPSDGTQSGTRILNFSPSRGPGTTTYFSHREYMPLEMAYLVCPTSDGSVQGSKLAIQSGSFDNSSHTEFENVWENSTQAGAAYGYIDSAEQSFRGFETQYTPPGLPFDFMWQNTVGNDGSGVVSPDSVYAAVSAPGAIDPDDGLAFSNSKTNPNGGTLQQIEWARIGGSYNSRLDPAYMCGIGHPLGGGIRYPYGAWVTWLRRVDWGTYGGANSRVRDALSIEGGPYYQYGDMQGVTLDQDQNNGFNRSWLMPYYTNRIAGGISVASQSNPIPGVTVIGTCIGLGSALGAGTLSYQASTKRLTWTEAGGTPGIPRGCAPWKKWLAVATGGGGNVYATAKQLGLLINYANLPATDMTNTVTLQSGRMGTFTCKAEWIVSSQPINATAFNSAGIQVGPTGGYAPPF